ncbi:MAG: DUF4340 domain-containing protein [Microgenomates group bacterium]
MEKINFKPLLVILILFLGFLSWRNFGEKILPKKNGYLNQLEIKKENIQKITLTQNEKSLEIKKDKGVWQVAGKKAKEVQVNDLLEILFPSSEPVLVAKTSSRHKEMKVDDQGALKIKLNEEKEIWLGVGSGGNYLRFPGKDEVWFVAGSWFSPTIDFSFWVDKTIISLDSSKLKKIEWRSPPKIKTYEKKEGSWWEKEKKIEDKILDPIITTLSPLIADEVIEKERPTGYSLSPKITLTLDWEGGQEKLEFFKGTKNWLIKRGSDNEEFLIGEEKIKNLISF